MALLLDTNHSLSPGTRIGGVLLQGDVDGDAVADFLIQLLGVPALAAADMLL